MGHIISGIVTSFRYKGDLPNIILTGNYHLIPFENDYGKRDLPQTLKPYDELTKEACKILRELSFKGKCAYIETEYFGGSGVQISEAWENGQRIIGPLISFDGNESYKMPEGATVVEEAINETLRTIGVSKHEGKDEFDSVRLGYHRSNNEIIEEYNKNNI